MDLQTRQATQLAEIDYLERFINFIDASPNTIRTYKTLIKNNGLITPNNNRSSQLPR